MGLASGRSGLFSFQRTATRYLPFSYLRKSFTLPKASLSSSVNTSLPSRSVPDFSITQNLFQLLSRSQQDSFPSLQISSLVDKERITWDRVLAVSFSSGAPIQLHGDQRANNGVQRYQCRSKDRQVHHLPAWENCSGSDAAIYSDGRSISQHCNCQWLSADTFLCLFPLKTCHVQFRFQFLLAWTVLLST